MKANYIEVDVVYDFNSNTEYVIASGIVLSVTKFKKCPLAITGPIPKYVINTLWRTP